MASETEVVCPSCGERVPANFSECWQCQSPLDGATPIERKPGPACSHCGATDATRQLRVRAVGHGPVAIGLQYAGGSLVSDLAGGSVEPLHAELCTRCGTVQRFFVVDPDRLWMT